MAKKIIVLVVLLIGLAGIYSFGGEVPAKPSRTGGMITEDHAKVHVGQLYRTGAIYLAVAADSTAYFLVDIATTGFTANELHASIAVVVESTAVMKVFADPVGTSSGTLCSSYNLNRVIADSPTALFYDTPTLSSNGSIITPQIIVPAGMNSICLATFNRDGAEYVFNTGHLYLITVRNTNGQATADIGIYIDYYEQLQP